MGIFIDAVRQGNVSYSDGSQVIETTYNLGDGNHKVTTEGTRTNVITGNGNSIITSTGSNCTITTGNGNQKITSIGDNNNITTCSGDDEVVFIGDNVKLDTGDGDDSVIFWGDNCTVKTGAGDDSVTTFDQVYQQANYSSLADVFIDKLPTGTWEKWNKVSSDLIDYNCKKSFFKKKQTWVYEEHYDVETIFSRYVNGVKNSSIDMGGGTNTADVTLGSGSTIGGSGTNNITYNEEWQMDESLGHRDEVQLRTVTKKNTRWGNIALVGAAVAAAVVGGFAIAGAAGTGGAGAGAGAAATAGTSGAATAAGATTAAATTATAATATTAATTAAGATAAATTTAAASGGFWAGIGSAISSAASAVSGAVSSATGWISSTAVSGLTSLGVSASTASTIVSGAGLALKGYGTINSAVNIVKGDGSLGDYFTLAYSGPGFLKDTSKLLSAA